MASFHWKCLFQDCLFQDLQQASSRAFSKTCCRLSQVIAHGLMQSAPWPCLGYQLGGGGRWFFQTTGARAGMAFPNHCYPFSPLGTGGLSISGIVCSEPMVTSLSLGTSCLLAASAFPSTSFLLASAFPSSSALSLLTLIFSKPSMRAWYCSLVSLPAIPLELPAMGKHAVHSLHLQIAPHLSTVFTCIQLRHFHQEGQQCLPQWLWVDHATGFQLYQVWPQWLQVQQWLSIWGRAWGNVLIAAQIFHHCPMLFRALIQKPHIYPGFCWVSGTTMFPRHGLCQDLGLGVFPKTRAWTFPSHSLFQNCSLLRLYIRFLELISQTAAQSWHAW